MRYLLLIYSPVDDPRSPEELEAEFAHWFEFDAAIRQSGFCLAGEALQGGETATTVRVRDGETLVTDGPFAETKELLGGFYMLDCDLETAQAWAAKMPNIAVGSVEVRPIMEIPALNEVAS